MRRAVDTSTAPRIDQRAAEEHFQRGSATFVDVRKPERYESSHIPHAISVPLSELPRRLHDIPSGRPIITYCA